MNDQIHIEMKEVQTLSEKEMDELELDIEVLDTSYSYGEARTGAGT